MFFPMSHVIVQPDDGTAPVLDFIRSARESLLIKQFTFTEPEIMQAVVDRKDAGVAVQIMLNPKRSGGDRANDETLAFFEKAGVNIQWASPKFYVTHEKSIVVDGKAALVATFNLCTKYFTLTRDYGVILQDPHKVAQVVEGFHADWNHQDDWKPTKDAGLLWSNNNARETMSRFIDTAKEKLDVQHPKFVDATILDRLLSAADRGVAVRVLCGGKHGISDWDILDTFSSLRVMHRGGIKVHKQKNFRLHAKLIIVDGAHALLGSMNIDRSAFDLRRELGTTLADPAIVGRLVQTFNNDWTTSHRYDAPDPLVATDHHEDDFPQDADLQHE